MSDLDDALYYARGVGLDDRQIAVAVRQAAEAQRAALAASEVVLMTHPELPDQPIAVPAAVVEGHENAGWVRAEPVEEEAPEEASEAPAEEETPVEEPAEVTKAAEPTEET